MNPPYSVLSFAACSLFAATAATAAPVTIDFEGVTSFASVGDYYAGGSDSAGVAGPRNLGISFTGPALALANDALGPYFSNAPTPGTVMFPTDAATFLNVASGFAGTVSFWYSSSSVAAGAVQVWSGLNGSGTLLASFGLTANAQSGCSDSPYCRWTQASTALAATGYSIGFGGGTGIAAFDNVTVTVTPVPEPTTTALLVLGLAGVGLGARARRRPGR